MDPLLTKAAEKLNAAKLEALTDHSDFMVVEEGDIEVETMRVWENNDIWLRITQKIRLSRMTEEEKAKREADHSALFKDQAELGDAPMPVSVVDADSVKDSDRERDRKLHEFHVRLTELVNEIGLENESGTPDHLISDYLLHCLKAFDRTVAFRAAWRGEQI